MKAYSRITAWLSCCICLILLTLGVFLWLNNHRSIPAELRTLTTPTNLKESPKATAENAAFTNPLSSPPPAANPQPVTLTNPPLSPVAYPLGSIGEACEVNEYPPRTGYFDLDLETRHSFENSPWDATGENLKQLQESKCLTAVESYMKPINPYLWGRQNDTHGRHSALALIVTDNPLTFERIFADPAGDFARVQEALARPECHPGDDPKSNWKLNETCHADAILNYALFTRFCYDHGFLTRPQQYYTKKDNPTPEQDRSMWIETLEVGWVWEKCETFDPNLNLRLPVHAELRQQIQKLQVVDEKAPRREQTLNGTLIDLAARLGDEAAGLTYPIDHNPAYVPFGPHDEEGYQYGPLAEWFTTDLTEPTNLFSKHPPSIDRLRHLVPLFATHIEASGGKIIKFNHEALVRHLCTPPYYTPPSEDTETIPEPPSCRTVANELRQEFHSDQSMLKKIATFEELAIRLDVYEKTLKNAITD